MAIKLDSSISILLMIGFGIFIFSFFFNVGVLTQINGSAFLEKFDIKKKLIKHAREKLFNYKIDALKKMICLFPYFSSIVLCYSISPFIIELMKKYFPYFLPIEYQVSFIIFLFLYVSFSIGEAFWGVNEKYIKRNHYRIYYRPPLYKTLFIVALYYGTCKLESVISIKQKQSIMEFLHVYNIETFQLMYIFAVVVFLIVFFVVKLITRWVVVIDNEIYISHSKEKNYYYSFYGMANLFLSILMMFISIFFAVKYSIWKETNLFAVAYALLMMLPLSVLAGQRDCFVSITRRKYIENNKLYYQDVNDTKRLVDPRK